MYIFRNIYVFSMYVHIHTSVYKINEKGFEFESKQGMCGGYEGKKMRNYLII